GRLDGDVLEPVRRDALLLLVVLHRVERCRVLPVLLENRVRLAVAHVRVVGGPAEQGAVELLRALLVRGRELGPAERTGGVRGRGRHLHSPLRVKVIASVRTCPAGGRRTSGTNPSDASPS